MWQWLHSWGSPKWFYLKSGKWLVILSIATFLLLVPGLIWGLFFTPADFRQGDSFRIIYIHVPAAALAQSAYVLMALAGAVWLIWRMKIADMAMEVLAPIGLLFCALALATGAIWGRPTWGTWWVWDARTTSTFLLLFLYLGVIALRQGLPVNTAGRACAVLALAGLVNIPVIKYSVKWWFTLHQGDTFSLTSAPSMSSEMYWPLLLTVLGFYLLFAVAALLAMQVQILERERDKAWVAELVAEKAQQVGEAR